VSGQVALVTGAGSGIGRAVALSLLREGATVWLVGLTPSKLRDVAEQANVDSDRVVVFPVELTNDDDVAALARRIEAEAGRLDILVHSAAVIAVGAVDTASVDDFDRQYHANLRGPFTLTQALLRLLRASQGQIVFINSTAGLNAPRNVSQYSATKAGLRALADSLRAEINPDGVRVTTVYAGRTATPMQEALHRVEGRKYDAEALAQPDDVAACVMAALTLPRTAEVTELVVRPMRNPMPVKL
jgi:NAD(P)-dependent dehydrogenase (short-subunit alcohol dehydrogenase family)